MYLDSNNIEKYLKGLDKNSSPKWGTLNPSQMLFHCNNFIEVSLGRKKLNFITRLSSRLFFRYFFLKYLNYIDFNISKLKRNSATLPIFKTFPKVIDLDNEKNRLIKIYKKVEEIDTENVYHQMYGQIPSLVLKKLVCFHTSYHFNQFGLFS
ncbi:hypothetical protein N9321_01040 [Flavobacteriaceae bacterium]|nr:hypothetical protein [Flavobacteriaceae bacterium]MDB3874911.1 hypothetical protein [Flavobacteriaceae bacterium]